MIPIVVALCGLMACNENTKPSIDVTKTAMIPKPVAVKAEQGYFDLNDKTVIHVSDNSQELLSIGKYLADKFEKASGSSFKVSATENAPSVKNFISLSLANDDKELGIEGYNLVIGGNGIRITANTPAGVFYGVQTLIQLLPDDIEGKGNWKDDYRLGAATIRDFPSYAYRGSMLDVSRHFFNVDEVKRYIDLISFYKMNMLHLHLSDDQGWRIEIKSWPNLAKHGGKTEVGGGEGGYYTQEQYKELVKYAQDRYVTIIPEIDMPGHTNAALASYAELNCNNTAQALYTKTEVGFSSLCVRKDVTYKFIDDVVRELTEITPGPYIHLGGDESHATKKDDFIYFINRVRAIPKKYGKKMIGWEEIAQADIDSTTIVQFWTKQEYAQEAVRKGAKIIMSPSTKVYLDMKYDSTTKLGLEWAARIEVDSAYNWALSNRVQGIPRESILGVEAPLWTETLTNMDEIEYMLFPRLPGVAEIGWTPEESRNWDEYKQRLGQHGSRMKALEIDFYESKQVSWKK